VVVPYFDDGKGRVIYHGDSREILPTLDPVDLVLTDPPYGISWARGVHAARNSKAHQGIIGDEDVSVRDAALLLTKGVPAAVFGSFYAPFPPDLTQVLVWEKPRDAGVVGCVTGFRRDVEPVFLVGPWPKRRPSIGSVLRGDRGQSATTSETGHPHTKPVDVVARLLLECPPGVVLDPFMGSGTTLRAAKDMGRPAIGIEIEERYCEIAVRRLEQEVLFP